MQLRDDATRRADLYDASVVHTVAVQPPRLTTDWGGCGATPHTALSHASTHSKIKTTGNRSCKRRDHAQQRTARKCENNCAMIHLNASKHKSAESQSSGWCHCSALSLATLTSAIKGALVEFELPIYSTMSGRGRQFGCVLRSRCRETRVASRDKSTCAFGQTLRGSFSRRSPASISHHVNDFLVLHPAIVLWLLRTSVWLGPTHACASTPRRSAKATCPPTSIHIQPPNHAPQTVRVTTKTKTGHVRVRHSFLHGI